MLCSCCLSGSGWRGEAPIIREPAAPRQTVDDRRHRRDEAGAGRRGGYRRRNLRRSEGSVHPGSHRLGSRSRERTRGDHRDEFVPHERPGPTMRIGGRAFRLSGGGAGRARCPSRRIRPGEVPGEGRRAPAEAAACCSRKAGDRDGPARRSGILWRQRAVPASRWAPVGARRSTG